MELVHRSLVAEPPGGLVLDGMDEVHVPSDAKAHLTLGLFGLLALACAEKRGETGRRRGKEVR